jgi:hypothetical protein
MTLRLFLHLKRRAQMCDAAQKERPAQRFAMLRLIHPPGETQARIASHFVR